MKFSEPEDISPTAAIDKEVGAADVIINYIYHVQDYLF